MTRPVRHPKTGVYWFRKRVPAALVPLVGKREERRSLATKDPQEAKRACARVGAEVDRRWASLRRGAANLDHREAHALAGEVYHDIVGRNEREPGSAWGWSLEADQQARLQARYGDPQAELDLAELLAPEINGVLDARGIAVDDVTWERLKRAVGDAMLQAHQHLAKRARGDFRPDPDADRFPAAESDAFTWDEAWLLYLQQHGPSEATQKRWRTAVRSFVKAVGTDMRKVTDVQVVSWRNALLVGGLNATTVRDVYMASVRAVLACAKSNLKLKAKPVAGIRTVLPKKVKLREKEFKPHEVNTILAATIAQFGHLVTPEHAAARRWMP